MDDIELYKTYLTMAVYRLGGECVVTVEEFDEMRKVVSGVSCGVTKDNKFLMRSLVKS